METMPPLPPMPARADKKTCGICEGAKIAPYDDEYMWCPHCDELCNGTPFTLGPCGICEGGYRGLDDR